MCDRAVMMQEAPCAARQAAGIHVAKQPLIERGMFPVDTGRQARERARYLSILKKQRQIEDKRSRMGVALSHVEAARRIQAAIRGLIWRRKIKRDSDQELMFIGMMPKVWNNRR